MKRDILWLSCLLVLCVAVFCVQHAFKKSVRSAPVAASVFDHQQSSDKEISNEISEAIEGFCKKWSPPSATKGYGWDYKGAWTSLRNTLSRHKRKELVIAELLRWLEKPNLDVMLREVMAQMIFTINELEQRHLYTRLYNSPKNSAKALGLSGLARLQEHAAFQHAISLTLGQTKWPSLSEIDNIKTGIRAIRSYFGRKVALQVPSEHWYVLYTDHPQDSEFLLLRVWRRSRFIGGQHWDSLPHCKLRLPLWHPLALWLANSFDFSLIQDRQLRCAASPARTSQGGSAMLKGSK